MADSVRIRLNDSRSNRFDHLKDALDENATSKALDKAAEYTIRMRGGTTAVPTGQLAELMQLATEQGSVTPAEIAEILDTDVVSVDHESSWSVGDHE